MDINNYHRDKDYLENENMFRNIFQKRVNIISKHIKMGKVLEIGSSTGVMLKLFKDNGWSVVGVEPSGSADEAKKKGLNILKITFEKADLPKNNFDLIIMNHVFEHLDNPANVLKKVNSLLKVGGYLFIDVPNYGSLLSKILGKSWPYLLPEEHKSQFTRSSLSSLLRESGFKVVHWESQSGIFEYANPLLELKRKRFLVDILSSPFALISTILNMGDSMSFVAKKV